MDGRLTGQDRTRRSLHRHQQTSSFPSRTTNFTLELISLVPFFSSNRTLNGKSEPSLINPNPIVLPQEEDLLNMKEAAGIVVISLNYLSNQRFNGK